MSFKVSVIVPVYNASKYVRKAVESAIRLVETGEVLLIEDYSSDNSLEVCRQLENDYSNVKLIRHEHSINLGAGAARNLGIEYASYDFIAFLDADDSYCPNRFQTDKFIFNTIPNTEGVYGCTINMFEEQSVKERFLKRYPSVYSFTEEVAPSDLLHALLFGGKGSFHTNSITLRKSVFKKVGFFDTDLKLAQDTELWARLAAKCILLPGNINEPIAVRTVHAANRVHAEEEVIEKYKNLLYFKLIKWAVSQRDLDFKFVNQFFMAYHLFVDKKKHSALYVLNQLIFINPNLLLRSFYYRKLFELLITLNKYFN